MMNDSTREAIRAFIDERDWKKFHSPENLAKSIAIESAELLECFQWNESNIEDATFELADVLTYCMLMCDALSLDPDDIVRQKLKLTAEKYPVSKAKGKSTKYDQL